MVLPEHLRLSYEQFAAGERAIYAVLDGAGSLVAASPGIYRALAHDLAILPPGTEAFFMAPRQGNAGKLSGVAKAYQIDGQVLVIQAAQSEDHGDVLLDTMLVEFADEHGWVVLLFIVILLATTFATVRGTLRPVRVASELATRIVPGDAASRLPEADMPVEVLPLIEAVNRAFARLQTGIEVQRAFSADAAHQLRTPLAILNVQIDQVADTALK
ncbi:MAG: hypothetical protein O3A38_02320, partial [Proteobacteria bacterium]|nr:hypothetical protein [Pseudomonadota bacterium]